MSRPVRTRIAPSPTGAPHIGTAYIALHNLAFARRHGGQFILRIEDTDQGRSTRASEDQILSSLRWLGLNWEEGPDCGGPHGPYRQSERLGIYQHHAWELVSEGKAYPCFCTKERMDKVREEQMAQKKNPGYDGHCRNIDPQEAKKRTDSGENFVIRLKIPLTGETKVYDEIREQDIVFQNCDIDDQVLMKADGFPTYHLANVVDDHLMEITHVMRGEEWISSAPKHVILYEAFGWEAPKFMHLALLRNEDKSKISKRKNPTSLTWFMARGYCREALTNFLALMGHSISGDRETFTFEELVEVYDISRISTSAPIFDFAKLDRFNANYIQEFSRERLLDYQREALEALMDYVEPLREHLQKRIKSIFDLGRWTKFLFDREADYHVEAFRIKKLDQVLSLNYLKDLSKEMGKTKPTTLEEFKELCSQCAEKHELQIGPAFMLLRVAIMGEQESLPLFEVMEFLGADLTMKRLKDAEKFIKSNWPFAK
jgi:glutamyl-tRNA synthetase